MKLKAAEHRGPPVTQGWASSARPGWCRQWLSGNPGCPHGSVSSCILEEPIPELQRPLSPTCKPLAPAPRAVACQAPGPMGCGFPPGHSLCAFPCLQGVLHHHGEVGDQHQGGRDLAEPCAERVHPDPVRCHHRGVHKGKLGVGGMSPATGWPGSGATWWAAPELLQSPGSRPPGAVGSLLVAPAHPGLFTQRH